MSSTNKTTNLKLNDWVGTDVPQREDFNADNQRIDKAIGDHTGNTTVHITQAERDLWGLPFYYYNYFGNGKVTEEHGWNMRLTPTMYSMCVWTEPVRFRSLY